MHNRQGMPSGHTPSERRQERYVLPATKLVEASENQSKHKCLNQLEQSMHSLLWCGVVWRGAVGVGELDWQRAYLCMSLHVSADTTSVHIGCGKGCLCATCGTAFGSVLKPASARNVSLRIDWPLTVASSFALSHISLRVSRRPGVLACSVEQMLGRPESVCTKDAWQPRSPTSNSTSSCNTCIDDGDRDGKGYQMGGP